MAQGATTGKERHRQAPVGLIFACMGPPAALSYLFLLLKGYFWADLHYCFHVMKFDHHAIIATFAMLIVPGIRLVVGLTTPFVLLLFEPSLLLRGSCWGRGLQVHRLPS